MNKLKELWQYPVFRWCVYQTPLLVFGLLLRSGWFSTEVDFFLEVYTTRTPEEMWMVHSYHFGVVDLQQYAKWIWVLIFWIPAMWVWRRAVVRMWKSQLRWLNKQAEEG